MPEIKQLPDKYEIWTPERFSHLTGLTVDTINRRFNQAVTREIMKPMNRPRAWNRQDAQRFYEFLQVVIKI